LRENDGNPGVEAAILVLIAAVVYGPQQCIVLDIQVTPRYCKMFSVFQVVTVYLCVVLLIQGQDILFVIRFWKVDNDTDIAVPLGR
jgi:hypothetical protein